MDSKGVYYWKKDKKAGYIAADFYNEGGPLTLLEPPSKESYKKKLDFESSKISEWLLS
jgi:hypothetical protein